MPDPQLPVTREVRVPPDPEGLGTVLRRIGYSLEDAVADVVDNSIDARAKVVLIRFVRSANRIARVVIADDGIGMTEAELHHAMQFGVRGTHRDTDLGKYGIGLKAASLSQAGAFTVLSRSTGEVSGCRWTKQSVADDWRLEIISASDAASYLDGDWRSRLMADHGTVVIWDALESLGAPYSNFDKSHARRVSKLDVALGMRFHRFLDDGSVQLMIDTSTAAIMPGETVIAVQSLDPFGYARSGRRGYPLELAVRIDDDHKLALHCHIWPPKSKDPNFRLGGGSVAARQGFYFYRNNRMISAGGWHGFRGDSEPHLSLARVGIDVPPVLDSYFHLTVQKHDFVVPAAFVEALRSARTGETTFQSYLDAAQETYRSAPKKSVQVPIPASGVRAAVRDCLRRSLLDGDAEEIPVDIQWKRLPVGTVVALDRGAIAMNVRYKSQIANAADQTNADLFKVALFFALYNLLLAKRHTASVKTHVQRLNDALLAVLNLP